MNNQLIGLRYSSGQPSYKQSEFQGKTHTIGTPPGNYKVGQVDEQGHWTGDDATTGKVAEKDKNVTYVYQLKQPKGNVYVHYVDVNGNTIKASVTDELAQPVGKNYDTVVDNRPQQSSSKVRHKNWYQLVTTK